MDSQAEYVEYLVLQKYKTRYRFSNMTPDEKIARLLQIQEKIYSILAYREIIFGRPIPRKWQQWHGARHPLTIRNSARS